MHQSEQNGGLIAVKYITKFTIDNTVRVLEMIHSVKMSSRKWLKAQHSKLSTSTACLLTNENPLESSGTEGNEGGRNQFTCIKEHKTQQDTTVEHGGQISLNKFSFVLKHAFKKKKKKKKEEEKSSSYIHNKLVCKSGTYSGISLVTRGVLNWLYL